MRTLHPTEQSCCRPEEMYCLELTVQQGKTPICEAATTGLAGEGMTCYCAWTLTLWFLWSLC